MQTTLTHYLKHSTSARALRYAYHTPECACFHGAITDETKKGKPKRVRVKFYTCALHREDNDLLTPNIDIFTVPHNYPLNPRDAFRQKQRLLVEAKREQLLKFREEHSELVAQVSKEMNEGGDLGEA